ncbi:hypothetical protein INR49_029675, partial [Caranx melampygus]
MKQRQAYYGLDPKKLSKDSAADQEIPKPKCGVPTACSHDHFAIHVRSGTADIVGPKICFDGRIIMSHSLNNIAQGLNIVAVSGETGAVEKFGTLDGSPEDTLKYLKELKPGTIVLVASYNDVAPKLTDEVKEVFVKMGSTSVTSVKTRDSWVFAGRAGSSTSHFEKKSDSGQIEDMGVTYGKK